METHVVSSQQEMDRRTHRGPNWLWGPTRRPRKQLNGFLLNSERYIMSLDAHALQSCREEVLKWISDGEL